MAAGRVCHWPWSFEQADNGRFYHRHDIVSLAEHGGQEVIDQPVSMDMAYNPGPGDISRARMELSSRLDYFPAHSPSF